MKRWTKPAGLALFGMMAASPALAEPAIVMTDLNMRAGPGPEYPVVATIRSDSAVDVLGCMGSWCDVTVEGARGWASASYIAFDIEGSPVIVPEVGTRMDIPEADFEAESYWDENYRDEPFYVERERYIHGGFAGGAATGAIAGAVVGGPVGAAVGGLAGAAIGTTIVPPERVTTYIEEEPVEPVRIDREVSVGVSLPETVVLHPVPEYEYQYAMVNSRPVLVEPGSRRVVYVYR